MIQHWTPALQMDLVWRMIGHSNDMNLPWRTILWFLPMINDAHENILLWGMKPLLLPKKLGAICFHLVAYPLTLLSSAAFAMRQAVFDIKNGKSPETMLSFSELKALVNFDAYDDTAVKWLYEFSLSA